MEVIPTWLTGRNIFIPITQSEGDPFFFSEPRSAVIRIHEKEFEGQLLRYDVFNQKLILDFKDIYGATPAWFSEMNGLNHLLLRNQVY